MNYKFLAEEEYKRTKKNRDTERGVDGTTTGVWSSEKGRSSGSICFFHLVWSKIVHLTWQPSLNTLITLNPILPCTYIYLINMRGVRNLDNYPLHNLLCKRQIYKYTSIIMLPLNLHLIVRQRSTRCSTDLCTAKTQFHFPELLVLKSHAASKKFTNWLVGDGQGEK